MNPLRSGFVVAGPPRPGEQWPGPRPFHPPRVVGDIFNPKPEDTVYPCPYNSSHFMSMKKYRKHVGECRRLYIGPELKTCPFNACHEVKVRLWRVFQVALLPHLNDTNTSKKQNKTTTHLSKSFLTPSCGPKTNTKKLLNYAFN